VTGLGALIGVGLIAGLGAEEPASLKVTVVKATRGVIEWTTEQPGQLEAWEEALIHARIAGYVESVLVDIGDIVQKGQPLLLIAAPELVEEVQQKEALVAKAIAELGQAAAGVTVAKARADSARALASESEAAQEKAEALAAGARDRFERLRKLGESRSVTEEVVAEAENAFRAAEGGRREARARIVSANAALAEATARIVAAEADGRAAESRVAVAKADLRHAQTMLDFATPRAPFDGRVAVRKVHPGQLVASGSIGTGPLLSLVRTDRVRAVVEIPEQEASMVDPQDAATVRIPALGDRRLAGKISRVSGSVGAGTRHRRSEIDLPNPDGRLLPGLFLAASITLERRENALTLPKSSLMMEDRKAFVFVVRNGRLAKQPVTLGLVTATQAELLEGVGPDDRVARVASSSYVDGVAAEAVDFKPN
jgi:multidrug efflux pump subunit AcrA (membrane-fusion protein)